MHISSENECLKTDFDEIKHMCFLIKSDHLLEKYMEIREKVNNSIKKESEPAHNDKYLNAKIKSYNGKINTNFYNKIHQEKVFNVFVYQ